MYIYLSIQLLLGLHTCVKLIVCLALLVDSQVPETPPKVPYMCEITFPSRVKYIPNTVYQAAHTSSHQQPYAELRTY